MVNNRSRMAEQHSFEQMLLQMSASSPPEHRPKLTWAVALPDLCAQAVSRNCYITLLQAQAVLLLRKSRRNARLKDAGLSWCLREKRHRP